AADERAHRVAERSLRRPQRGVRHRVSDFVRLREIAGLDLLGSDRGDRDRGLLQALFAIARSDHDLLQTDRAGLLRLLLLTLRLSLREHWSRSEAHQHADHRSAAHTWHVHDPLPAWN